MRPTKIIHLIVILGSLLTAGWARAESDVSSKPSESHRHVRQLQEINPEITAMIRQDENRIYASNAVGPNGMGTGNEDPVLIRLLENSSVDYRLLSETQDRGLASGK